MRFSGLAGVILAAAALTGAHAGTDAAETVPLYTGDDLDRMFGPVPAGPSVPTDTTTPEDWRWVEQFIDRQYARVDADREYDLNRRAQDISTRPTEPVWTGYGQPLAWGLGYPASTWWHTVWGQYSRSVYGGYGGYRHPQAAPRSPYARAMGEMPRAVREMPRRDGHPGGPRGQGGPAHRHR